MAIFSELRETLDGLESRIGDVDIDVLLTAMRGLDDEEIVAGLADAAAIANCAERVLTVGAAIIAERSQRDAGHSGLAATHGHRNAVSLVQSLIGGTRADAARAVRLGGSVAEGTDAAAAASAHGPADAAGVRMRWAGRMLRVARMLRAARPELAMLPPARRRCGCRGTTRCGAHCSRDRSRPRSMMRSSADWVSRRCAARLRSRRKRWSRCGHLPRSSSPEKPAI